MELISLALNSLGYLFIGNIVQILSIGCLCGIFVYILKHAIT